MVESSEGASPHDPLRHYVCATTLGEDGPLVVGNGEQVQHIASVLRCGGSPVDAADGLEPEPDPPIFTPRITVVITGERATSIGVLRNPDGSTERRVTESTPHPDEIVVLHTYGGTVEAPLGSAPTARLATRDRPNLTDELWSALNPDLRIMACGGSARSAHPDSWQPGAP